MPRKNKNRDSIKKKGYKFTDLSSGRRFLDPSSSGDNLGSEYILKQDFAQWLHENSGRDKIVSYAFSTISGPFTVGDGYWDTDNIESVAVNPSERDYITGQLQFLSPQIGVQFIEAPFESADIRFFASESGGNEYTGFSTVGQAPLDLVWERAGDKTLTPNIRLTISHEIAHGLGLEHVDEASGMSEKEMFQKWGVSDSLMISWEKQYDFYDSFGNDHQWFTRNDINALQLAWSRVV